MAGAAEGMAEGTMTMREIEAIELPAGATVSLQPGGFHVMLMDLAAPLETGDSFDVTLVFAEAGEQRITVEVREDAP
jgi:copper(I)-binding protein